MEHEAYTFSVVLLIFLLLLVATRKFHMPVLCLFSFMAVYIPVQYGMSASMLMLSAGFLILLAISIILSEKQGIFRLDRSADIKWWRIIARPFAMLFIPIDVFMGHLILIYLLGILSSIFILTDLFRLLSKKELPLFYKKSEVRRFSSMSSFLIAIFLIFLLFHSEVAYLCLVFILFGDLAGKIIGIQFGKIDMIHGRTMEGSLGFLAGSLYSGMILGSIFDIDLSHILIGALCATITELFSFSIDDNFTVGIITGGGLEALIYFNVI